MYNLVKFFEYNSDVVVKDIPIEDYNEVYDMITNFGTSGKPKIGLYKNNLIIGAILLDEDYLPWEYRFDVIIKRGYRGRGYFKLLMNKIIEDFKNDEQAEQLSAIVINKKLTKILEEKYGFIIGDFDGDDFAFIQKKGFK